MQLQQLTLAELAARLDPAIRPALQQLAARPGVAALVLFTGTGAAQSVLTIGPGCRYHTLAELEHGHLGSAEAPQWPSGYALALPPI